MRILTAIAASFVLLGGKVVSAPVEGRVYLDRNRNGLADADERGVARVAVSDGMRVVVTDEAGRYRLDAADASLPVWVCVPRDHVSSGPFWRPSGGGNADFGLIGLEQSDDFHFLQITDTHVGREDLVKTFAGQIQAFPVSPAFAVNTGDLVGGVDVVSPDKAQAQYDRYLAAAAAFRVPLFHLPGNHEHVAFNTPEPDTAHPFYGKGLYRKIFGPTYYSWNWAGVHFVALDGTSLPYQERLGTNQLAWLAADVALLPAEQPLVLFCHQPVHSLRDTKELAEILRGRNVLGAFCGHLHKTFATQLSGFPVYLTGAMSGAWWSGPNIDGTPQGFRWVQIQGGDLRTVYASRDGATPMSVIWPLASSVQSGVLTAEVAVVDFGRPVELSGSYGGQAVPMKQTSREACWSVWSGAVDTRLACDGERALELTAKQGEGVSRFSIRYLVSNGRAEDYQADAPALFKLTVRNIDADDLVLFNGDPLGVIAASTPAESVLSFEVAKERLSKLNRVTVKAARQGKGLDTFSVGPAWLEYKGRKLHDLRYASFERFTLTGADPRRSEKELLYCLP